MQRDFFTGRPVDRTEEVLGCLEELLEEFGACFGQSEIGFGTIKHVSGSTENLFDRSEVGFRKMFLFTATWREVGFNFSRSILNAK